MNVKKRDILNNIFDKLLDEDIIEPSDSDWGCNPVIVPKDKK
jgi:hypothetical protein